ncbi:MAG: hydrolase 2, exosortase A system-associated [Gammaproteobacteria bacterium]
MANSAAGGFAAQFLRSTAGELFVLSYPGIPRDDLPPRALVVVPAFAEEMNKTRRQIALLGRALAPLNITTIVPDLYGTGDSAGDFGEATVSVWRDDLKTVFDWLTSTGFTQVSALGVRAGALLLTDVLRHTDIQPDQLLLWQPVVSGKTLMSQFLRLKAAASLTQETKGEGVRELRARLSQDESVEVAGYWLSPDLVAQFDALHLRDLDSVARLDWLQVQDTEEPPPAVRTVMGALQERGIEVDFAVASGEPFWSTVEISLAPALIDVTVTRLWGA